MWYAIKIRSMLGTSLTKVLDVSQSWVLFRDESPRTESSIHDESPRAEGPCRGSGVSFLAPNFFFGVLPMPSDHIDQAVG